MMPAYPENNGTIWLFTPNTKKPEKEDDSGK